MAAAKRFMNWTQVTFTPTGGTASTIVGVTDVQIDTGGSLIKLSGDGDRYNTTVINDFHEPTVTIKSNDLISIAAFPVGTVGTFSATHNDARNGTGTGAMTYTVTNAVVASNPLGGSHRKFGEGTLTLTSFAPDGVTNPLTVSLAT